MQCYDDHEMRCASVLQAHLGARYVGRPFFVCIAWYAGIQRSHFLFHHVADAARTDAADSLFDFHQWGIATNKPEFNGEWVKLGDLCGVCSGGTPKRSVSEYWNEGSIPWVKISDISGKFVSSTEELITEAGLKGSSAKLLAPSTLLYSIFASIGAVGILKIPAATNQAIAGLSIKTDRIERDYLYHFLKSRESLAKSSGRGAAQNNINLTILRGMEVPVPAIGEQKAIVEQLEIIATQIKQAETQLDQLDFLVKSRFVEMFGNVSTTCRVQDVATIYNGDRGKNYPTADDKVLAGYPFINAGNLEGGKVSFDSMDYITAEKYQTLSGGKIRKNDILYCLRGSLGKSAICDFDGGTIASSLMVIRANIDEVSPRYLFEALNTPDVIRQMHAADNGSSQPNLSAKSVKSYLIPLPSKELQQQFADFVAKVDKLGFGCCRMTTYCDALFSSVSARLLRT